MELDPDTEMAKLVIEFAQRSDREDMIALWSDSTLIDRIKKSVAEIQDFDKLNPGKLESQASNLATNL